MSIIENGEKLILTNAKNTRIITGKTKQGGMQMNDIRCNKCGKLLFKMSSTFKGEIEVKCYKCKNIISYKIEDLETHRKQVS